MRLIPARPQNLRAKAESPPSSTHSTPTSPVTLGELLFALLVDVVQGLLEWLPVSSQSNVSLVLTLLMDIDPAVAVDLALIVQLGTVTAAAPYYRDDIA